MSLHSSHTSRMPPADNRSAGIPANGAATPGIADWLRLAAAPTFAIMALLTAFSSDAGMICSAAPDVLPINGMSFMYMLMSIFHLTPWFNVIARLRSRLIDGR